MRERFLGSMVTVAIAATITSVLIARATAQAPAASIAAPAASALKNALGRTGSTGHLDRRN
jgi:hypothetical protein